jgi:DNA-binding NarL/FixJ family response regulator
LGLSEQPLLFALFFFATGFHEMDKSKTLTAREKQIIGLLADGLTNRQVAEKLFVSKRTIDAHRRGIKQKTGEKTLAGLVKYAIRNGLSKL